MKNLRLAALLSVGLMAAPAFADPVELRFDPDAQTVDLGSFVTVDVIANPLDDDLVAVFDFLIDFNSSIVDIVAVSFGTALNGGDPLASFPFAALFGPGTLNIAEVSLLDEDDLEDAQGGAITLATLTFEAIAVGTSDLLFSGNILGQQDPFNFLGDEDGDALEAIVFDGSITVVDRVQPVSEPGVLLLSAIGLLAAGWATRRRRRG